MAILVWVYAAGFDYNSVLLSIGLLNLISQRPLMVAFMTISVS